MKKALVLGGSSGIGLALAVNFLEEYSHVYIAGRTAPDTDDIPEKYHELFAQKTSFHRLDLNNESYDIFDEITDIDTLVITAGFGRVALFESLTETEIANLIKCNALGVIQVIKKYYQKLSSPERFNCAVMVSISGHIVSPYVSVYGAAKAAVASFIESVNIELASLGTGNRILDVSPGYIPGTAFNGGTTNLECLEPLASDIIANMMHRKTLFIPQYDEVYKNVLDRYHSNPEKFGMESFEYKANSNRIRNTPQVTVGFLSGTFDLFHVGHLNLLRRAKEQCDYLIVSVHDSGAWKGKQTFIPYEERRAIVESICYVDKVVEDFAEDTDAWSVYHYDKLFVGSDYKGSERFNRYEKYFADKNVEIVYFPYTKGTSSTQLREKLSK